MENHYIAHHPNTPGLIDAHIEDPVLRTFILFVQAAREVMKYKDALFYRKNRLSDTKTILLMAFYKKEDATLTASGIAQWTQTSPHNISTLIRRIKRDGLINIERDKRNKRFVNITLTDKGREVLNQVIPVSREIVSQVMSSITKEDVAVLEEQLRVIRDNAHRGWEQVARSS